MIGRTAGVAAVMAIGSPLAPLFAAPGERGFKIGAPDWSLHKNDPSCFELAKEIGLDGVQVDVGGLEGGLHMRKPAEQQAYLAAARKSGLQIASTALGILNQYPLKSDVRGGIWLLDAMTVAQALGVKVILVPAFAKGDLYGDKAGIDRTVEVLKEAAPHAEKAGVILGLENYLSGQENLDILQRVGSPAVQVYYDVGNMTDKHYDIYQDIRLLKGNICEFHAKDGGFMLGQGRIDFHKVREAMNDIGYRGWMQIEAKAPHSVLEDYRADLKYLREIFPA